ncbi:hypothetical protein M433DRAFT_279378 [Acidomyces richmondensis BFW]|nr:MAG: hypothetical protein FE78DRAFT_71839 [Acidomyces sp. 'richmondensis']KYG44906.1 hypothetical protein M433DRAFT_279378 [Acidomyces richmondensis BFW]
MPAPSLQAIAIRASVRNIGSIHDVADMPPELARPILKHVKNPQQLKEIEDKSPHLRDLNADLWKEFIKRDIPKAEQILSEKEPKSQRKWRTFYFKLLAEKERAEKEDEAKLAAIMKGLDRQKEINKANFVPKIIPQRGSSRGSAFIDGQRNPRVSNFGIVRPQTTSLRNAKTGRDAIAAIRKQTAQAHHERFGSKNKYTMDTSKPKQNEPKVQAAPDWMVREAMKPKSAAELVQQQQRMISPASHPLLRPKVFTPSAGAPSMTEHALKGADKKREARLLALTQPNASAVTASASPPTSNSASSTPKITSTVSRPVQAPSNSTGLERQLSRSTGSTSKLSFLTKATRETLPTARLQALPKATIVSMPAAAGSQSEADTSAVEASQKRPVSPNPATTPLIRKRQAPPSIFIPAKKKKAV